MKRTILISTICLVASIFLTSTHVFADDPVVDSFFDVHTTISVGPVERPSANSVPEPSTMFLLGSGLFVFGLVSKKRMIR